MSNFDVQDKELIKLKDRIKLLNKDTWFKIYFVIKNNNEEFTFNHCGLHFDLTSLSEKSITEINEIVDLFLSTNQN